MAEYLHPAERRSEPSRDDRSGLVPWAVVERRLANGLRVVLLTDERLPLVALNTTFAEGSGSDPEGLHGLSHLCEHLALDGPGGLDKGYAARTEQLGGMARATTHVDRLCYRQTLPADGLYEGLKIEAERMAFPTDTDKGKMERQRQILLQEYAQHVVGRPYGDALANLFGLLFPNGHPYSRMPLGVPDEMRRIELADVTGRAKAVHSPHHATLAVVGDFEADRALHDIESLFGPLGAAAFDGLPAIWPTTHGGETRQIERDVPMARCYLAGIVPAPSADDWVALQLWAGCMAAMARRELIGSGVARELQVGTPRFRDALVVIFEATVTPGNEASEVGRTLRRALEKAGRAELGERLDRVREQYLLDVHTRLQSLERKASLLATELDYFDRASRGPIDVARIVDRHDPESLNHWRAERLGSFDTLLTVVPR